MGDIQLTKEHYAKLNANPSFDLDVALRCFQSIDVEWREQYNNSPDIVLTLKEGVSLETLFPRIAEYPLHLEIPANSRGFYYYRSHKCGLVEYFIHDGKEGTNEGGFGGAIFKVETPTGKQKALRGPWSSRATCVNMHVEQEDAIADIILIDGKYRYASSIKVEALKALLEHFQPPFSIVREAVPVKEGRKEKACWTASLYPNVMDKPGGRPFTQPHIWKGMEVLYNHLTKEVFAQ